ncbi:MAG: hypothetical protein IT304_00440 [Dehalococcoidia bacterium]|nr:hypothetical protein [Dehalococcoidia bacterium]
MDAVATLGPFRFRLRAAMRACLAPEELSPLGEISGMPVARSAEPGLLVLDYRQSAAEGQPVRVEFWECLERAEGVEGLLALCDSAEGEPAPAAGFAEIARRLAAR